jgi:hypothetical protein
LWVLNQIFQYPDFSEQVKMFNHFILVAQECFQLNSFNIVHEILTGFQREPGSMAKHLFHISVQRHQQYEELISQISVPHLERLVCPPLIPIFANFKNYTV